MARKKLFNPSSIEPFPLSRSKLELFLQCPRCFWLDRVKGISRPPGFPLTLNMAVDTLLKKEFDVYRAQKQPHPLMTQYGVDAVPFSHPDLGTWRSNFKGITALHAASNLLVSGAVDDIWVKPDGTLIVVDYKATSTSAAFSMEDAGKQAYKRQLEVYQWLFRQNGYQMDSTAYLVYSNATKAPAAFNARLDFEMSLLTVDADDSWVASNLEKAKACLSGLLPEVVDECAFCDYGAAWKEACS